LFAHGDKQLLCTWPKPGAKEGNTAAHGLPEHSHLPLLNTQLASAGSSRCVFRDPRHTCACLGTFSEPGTAHLTHSLRNIAAGARCLATKQSGVNTGFKPGFKTSFKTNTRCCVDFAMMELVRFYPAALNGWLSIARNEHHRDEVKSLKGLSGQHMQPSQDVRPQAAFPLAHLPPPPLQTQLLWLRASFLPEE
ncbi:Peroxidasin, partial [Dissostichus eleginoides]